MVQAPALEAALGRLTAAMERLEAAAERRFEADRSAATLEEEIVRLGEDRSRIVQDLDQEKARSTRLEDTNREVSRRLVAAMESIRAVLDAHGG
jgi:predicted  nucleic acid-binding Zn-ribbon protein